MNKIKKINIVLIIIILIGCMFTSRTYAVLNCNVSLSTPKDKVTYKEEFSVYVAISNLQTTKGIIAIGAVLSYDTDSLTLVDIEGENKWSDPFYSSSNGKLTSFKNKLSTSNENVFKITFEVNEKGKAKNSAWIKISNFEISDGDEEKNCGGNSINIIIEEPNNEASGDNNQGNNNSGGNSGNNNQQGNNQGNNNSSGNHQGSNTGNGSQNSQNNPVKKPSTGTTSNIANSNSTNNKGENSNNEETTNNIENSVDTNIIENNVNEEFTNEENIIEENDIQNNLKDNTNTKENKQPNKVLFYVVSIVTVLAIVGILFLVIKYWKIN